VSYVPSDLEIPTPFAVPAAVPIPAVVENRAATVAEIASPTVSSASSLPVNLFASSVLATTTTLSPSSTCWFFWEEGESE